MSSGGLARHEKMLLQWRSQTFADARASKLPTHAVVCNSIDSVIIISQSHYCDMIIACDHLEHKV